jgi:type IV pilus assembly protein PilY1
MVKIKLISNIAIQGIIASAALFCLTVTAQTPNNATYNINPPLSEPAKTHPMLMLTLSGDHQIYLKAYNDFDDLDGDGLPDVTYNHNVVYKGYFNEEKCYSYDTTTGVFSPVANATAPTATNTTLGIRQPALSIKQYCTNSRWSGNFLNWATMTRIDIVRSVLYGGKRSTDTSTSTILERAYLPNDAHSFAKYYNGSDITSLTGLSSTNYSTNDSDQRKNGLTFCNTSLGHATQILSQAQTQTRPVMRVVRGNYSLWANGERYQCLLGGNQREYAEYQDGVFGANGNDSSVTGIHAYSTPPSSVIRDYTVRVAVCTDSSEDNINYCRRYGTSYKPTGLLQTYGIDSDNPVLFGLMTGAITKNHTAGVLRKNASSFANEVRASDGVFLKPSSGSIVASIDALMLLDYQFAVDNNFDLSGSYANRCPKMSSPGEGVCRNWGNPFSEILAESYKYFSGRSTTATLNNSLQNERNALSGATVATWSDPVTNVSIPACVNMNVLGINSSTNSYDHDISTSTFNSLNIGTSTDTVANWVDRVGAGELNSNKTYFVGNATGSTNGQCTPKAVSELSSVRGVCPEAPRLTGSYAAAGLAYHVKANNMRPDLSGNTGKVFNINTLGLTLAGTQPVIRIPGTNVKIIPACENRSDEARGNCALVGFRPVYTTAGQAPTKYFIAWEDSEQGNDFDQDINGIIEYTRNGNNLSVKTTIFKVSTNNRMFLGYIISGTNADGLKLVTEANNWATVTGSSTNPYTINTTSTSTAETLEPPLYYATKWGSYINSPADDDAKFNPALDTWTEDGTTPQNYSVVTNPSTLRENLSRILVKVGKNNATGTAAPVSINSITGEGIFLQTVYQPVYVSPDGSSSATWVGTLSALFIDRYGNIREDSNGNQTLDNSDKVVEFIKTDSRNQNADGTSETRKIIAFNRYPYSTVTNGKDASDPNAVETELKMDQLKTMWSARDRLAAISDTNITAQRGNAESPNSKRWILTGIDTPNASNVYNGIITASETFAFTGDTTTASKLRPYLDVASNSDATNVINYVRGKEITGFRNRTVKFDSASAAKVWRLGDIVNSTPAIVGAPSAGYDSLYGDDSYAAFRTKYAKRRNMVYVGANDGLLHAFNAGFFDYVNAKYTNTPTGHDASAPALGAEMWAYAPYNLLPHLKWLTQKNYEHVYFVDANVKVFDANVFASRNNNDKYPNGWGTILAVGMRYGGGAYQVDRDGSAATTNDRTTLRSAYILFDITDPESKPELIAEITHPDMGYTLADPEIIKRRSPNANGSYTSNLGANDWFMVFGSGPQGPDAVKEAISNAQAKLFYLNLKNAVDGNPQLTAINVDASDRKSFVGGITAKDWSKNYHDDMIYFGLVGDANRGSSVPSPAPAVYKGALKQGVVAASGNSILSAATVTSLLTSSTTNLAFSSAPLAVRDGVGQFWVFTGTGRFLVNRDVDLNDANLYFGLKVNDTANNAPKPWLTNSGIALTSLRNVTTDRLYVNDDGDFIVNTPIGIRTMTQYLSDIASTSGWYRSLPGSKESNFTRSAFYEGTLVFNSYMPSLNMCDIGGQSPQYILDMFTGLPQYRLKNLFKGSDTLQTGVESYIEVAPVGTLIDGIPSAPVIANARAITQTSDASLISTDVTLAPIPPVRKGWREILSEELR